MDAEHSSILSKFDQQILQMQLVQQRMLGTAQFYQSLSPKNSERETKFAVGSCSLIGRRRTNEDSHIIS